MVLTAFKEGTCHDDPCLVLQVFLRNIKIWLILMHTLMSQQFLARDMITSFELYCQIKTMQMIGSSTGSAVAGQIRIFGSAAYLIYVPFMNRFLFVKEEYYLHKLSSERILELNSERHFQGLAWYYMKRVTMLRKAISIPPRRWKGDMKFS